VRVVSHAISFPLEQIGFQLLYFPECHLTDEIVQSLSSHVQNRPLPSEMRLVFTSFCLSHSTHTVICLK
jgi:hypothetical protein